MKYLLGYVFGTLVIFRVEIASFLLGSVTMLLYRTFLALQPCIWIDQWVQLCFTCSYLVVKWGVEERMDIVEVAVSLVAHGTGGEEVRENWQCCGMALVLVQRGKLWKVRNVPWKVLVGFDVFFPSKTVTFQVRFANCCGCVCLLWCYFQNLFIAQMLNGTGVFTYILPQKLPSYVGFHRPFPLSMWVRLWNLPCGNFIIHSLASGVSNNDLSAISGSKKTKKTTTFNWGNYSDLVPTGSVTSYGSDCKGIHPNIPFRFRNYSNLPRF